MGRGGLARLPYLVVCSSFWGGTVDTKEGVGVAGWEGASGGLVGGLVCPWEGHGVLSYGRKGDEGFDKSLK